MRKRAARLAAALAVLGLFAAVPAAASANDDLTVKYHDQGKPLVVKVNL